MAKKHSETFSAVLGLAFLVGLYFVATTYSLDPFTFLQPRSKSAALDAVRDTVNDPDSIQFRDVKPCRSNKDLYEGKYNSRGEGGGYGDFKNFVAGKGEVYVSDEVNKPFSNIMFGIAVCAQGRDWAIDATKRYLAANGQPVPSNDSTATK